MTPKLEWLEAFAEFGADLNLTHAAARLHISQPALHAQIRKLADVLGVALYERRGRRLVLTPAGEQTLLFARQTLDRSCSFVERIRGVGTNRPVVLSAGEGAFLYLLSPAIRSFARRAPLRLLTRAAEPAVTALRRGEAHLAVAAIAETPSGLLGTVLAEVRHVVALRRKHRLARRRRLVIADLASEALVVPPPGSRLRDTVAAALASAGHTLRVSVEASGWEPMLQFVRHGIGSAVVNGCCRLPRGVVAVPLTDLPLVRYYLLRAPGSDEDARVTALHDAILAHRDDWRAHARVADDSGPRPTATPT